METKPSEGRQKQEAEIKAALGTFLLFFGLVLLVAIFFTDTPAGKWINLAAGLSLALIGLLMFRAGKKTGKA